MSFWSFFHCKNEKQTEWIWLSVQRFIDLATQGTEIGSDSSGDWLLFSWMFILFHDHTEHVLKGSTGLRLHLWKLDYIIPVSKKINQSCFPRTDVDVDTHNLIGIFFKCLIPVLLIMPFLFYFNESDSLILKT